MTVRRAEPLGQVRTKIVATLGPASRDPETIRALIEAGVDVFRLNFSHGDHAEHSENLKRIREEADRAVRVIAVLQDLGGPKIRLGLIPGDLVECHIDEVFTLVADRTDPVDSHQLTCTYRGLAEDLKVGDDVYFADGAVAMVVTEAGGGKAVLKVVLAGRLRSNQGINLPGAALNVEVLTGKDLRDLDWTAANPVEYVGLSFVRQGSDVARLRSEFETRGIKARIVAKIEKPQAVANLDAIIAEADALMVARGDLGVELDVSRVPAIQKQVIAACQQARVPVITATQMLNSMETSNRPTRAEATDVFNAVLDGTDAVMLSGETAIGAYPVEAVSTMSRIVTEAETLLLGELTSPWLSAVSKAPRARVSQGVTPITEALVEGVRLVAKRLGAKLVVVATKSGKTALALSKQRYAPPTLALCDDPATVRAMALYWGVTPLLYTGIRDAEATCEYVRTWVKGLGLAEPGDPLVVVQGTMPHHQAHNAMMIDIV